MSLDWTVSLPAAGVELVDGGVASLSDHVVRAAAAVDGVLPEAVAELVGTLAALDEVGATAAVDLVSAAEAGDLLRQPGA